MLVCFLFAILANVVFGLFTSKSYAYDAAIDEEIARLRKEDLENPPHPDECF